MNRTISATIRVGFYRDTIKISLTKEKIDTLKKIIGQKSCSGLMCNETCIFDKAFPKCDEVLANEGIISLYKRYITDSMLEDMLDE
jgi:hypothetical protein